MRISADRHPELFSPVTRTDPAGLDFADWLSVSDAARPVIAFDTAGLFRGRAETAAEEAPSTVSWTSLAIGRGADPTLSLAPTECLSPSGGQALAPHGEESSSVEISRAPIGLPTAGSRPLAPAIAPLQWVSATASEAPGTAPRSGRPAAASMVKPAVTGQDQQPFAIHIDDGAVHVAALLGTVCHAERRQLRSRVEALVATLGYSLESLVADGFNLTPAGGFAEVRHGHRRGQ